MKVLVVDAANVVGSRPNGWWRDRPGAARRLHESLVGADLLYDRVVVVVLEGQARAGVETGLVDQVLTVHATASGDDEIVAQCEAHAALGVVTLVSADRGLVARVADMVTEVLGPRVLLATIASGAEDPTRH